MMIVYTLLFRHNILPLSRSSLHPLENIMVQLKFEKAGYLVSLGANRNNKTATTEISLVNHGNVDLRQLPFPAGAEIHPDRTRYANCTTTMTNDEAFEFYC